MEAATERPAELVAPPEWRAIDFISDLHLAADTPLTFAAWADYLRGTEADVVLILGDLFEAWVGDDAIGEGFEAGGAAVLAEAATRRTLGFMVGNRDFLVGATMLRACGVIALADPTVVTAFGERVLLAHGDAMCTGDVPYQQFRELVRSPAWQRDFLARPLPERRAVAAAMRAQSEQLKAGGASWIDIDPATGVAALQRADAATLIHGHTHHPASAELAPGYRRHVLSDWDLDHAPIRAEVLRWQATGFTRLALADAVPRRR